MTSQASTKRTSQSPPPTPAPEAKRARRPGGRVIVNVGGQKFETTRLTLENGGKGYFAAAMGNTGQSLGGGEDGDDLFVDRCGTLFAHVLQFLRSRTLSAAVRADKLLLDDVAGEAEFFGLSDLVEACASRKAELESKRPRSFTIRVEGAGEDGPNSAGQYWWGEREREMPQAQEGEVVYLHSCVLVGNFATLGRLRDHMPSLDGYAKTGCYLESGRTEFSGVFKLQYKRAESEANNDGEDDEENQYQEAHSAHGIFTIAKRGLDDALVCNHHSTATSMHDINFREVLDVVVDGPIHLRAVGLGDWDVHGWVGPLNAIPRAGSVAPRS